MSEMHWYDWEAPRRRLQVWTKAILGGRRYRVRLDPDLDAPARHYTDLRVIEIDPCAWGEEVLEEWRALHDPPPEMGLPEFQWQCSKGLAAHEVGHARFTGGDLGRGRVRWLANSLEDERVERAMAGLYPALAPLFDFLSDVAFVETPPLDRDRDGQPVPDPDDPRLVLGACLLWRWEAGRERGRATKMRLSPLNRRRWYEVEPLVERAWMAETSEQVAAIARDILERLGIPPDEEPDDPDWLRDLLERLADLLDGPASGERRPGDEAEHARPATGHDGAPSRRRIPTGGGIADSVPAPDDDPTGGVVTPKPFLDLVAQARPLADRLAAELRLPAPEAAPEAVAYGGRFEVRQYVRTPDTPFIARTDPGDDVPRLAIQVLADRSGSMGVTPDHDDPDVRAWFESDPEWASEQAGKILAARLGLMVLHLACEALGIAHAITLFDGHVLVQDFDRHTEMTRALIAGWQGETGVERITDHLRERGPVLLARPEPIKVMLVVHDGCPVVAGDPDGIRRWQAEHEGRVLTIGVYLGDDEEEITDMRGLFRHLVAATPEAFPTKLGNLLRNLVPRGRRW